MPKYEFCIPTVGKVVPAAPSGSMTSNMTATGCASSALATASG